MFLVLTVLDRGPGLAGSPKTTIATPEHCPVTRPNGVVRVAGITFPAAGCWEITGRAGNASLTFVTLVVPPPNSGSRGATPTAAA